MTYTAAPPLPFSYDSPRKSLYEPLNIADELCTIALCLRDSGFDNVAQRLEEIAECLENAD